MPTKPGAEQKPTLTKAFRISIVQDAALRELMAAEGQSNFSAFMHDAIALKARALGRFWPADDMKPQQRAS